MLGVALLAPTAIRACTSFAVDCGDGAVVHARTLDFGSDLVQEGELHYYPAGTFATIPITPGGKSLKKKMRFGYVAQTLKMPETGKSLPPVIDGMNEAGLSLGVLWQYDVPFWTNFNASGPSSAITITDFARIVLGSMSTLAEVAAYANPSKLQITTDLQDAELLNGLGYFFGIADGTPPPIFNGALKFPVHLHICAAGGGCLLVEGIPGGRGYATYPTNVTTNAPSFPRMMQWMNDYR